MSRPAAEGMERFESDRFRGETEPELGLTSPGAEGERISDPASAVETIHWGRNYLYSVRLEATGGPVPAVVKQFRNQSWRQRLDRRLKGSKAERSWRIAVPMWRAGLPTPQPLMWLESRRADGPSLFVSRQISGATEARYLFRALKAGTVEREFPDLDVAGFAAALGRLIRRLHDADFWHRDLSIGNVLLTGELNEGVPDLLVIDLNRARRKTRLTVSQRTRDLCRLGFPDANLGARMLTAYWVGRERGESFKRALYRTYRAAYLIRVESRKGLRDRWRSLSASLFGRKPHVHIPAAAEGAAVRDKSVWDTLSDQPHQHASRSERLRVRMVDIGTHARAIGVALAALPRARRRYRELIADLWSEPVSWPGVGVAVGPESATAEELLEGLSNVGARHVLLRLHPWDESWDASEALARELSQHGVDLAFALPQVRDLVRDPARWKAAITEIGERFLPFGNRFQIGQAINRSKWGVWNYREYTELATVAAQCLRQAGPVELLGPAVIDFEPHAMAAAMNYPGAARFDIASSLLYVDRRGAPENEQQGYETLGKVALMRAISETAREAAERLWITEVNWPLWEGPHSPAGKTVSVDEERQADYLVRYYIPVLASGLAERVYWWQLVARGYGLIDPREDKLRPRPSYHALKTLAAQLEGTRAHGPIPSPENTLLHRFTHSELGELLVGWSLEGDVAVELPGAAERLVSRDGEEAAATESHVTLDSSPQYIWLSA